MEKIKTKEYAEVQVLLVVLKIKDKIKLERLNLTISFSKMAYNGKSIAEGGAKNALLK